MSGDGFEEARLQSELLELLYWLQGEGFGDDATIPHMLRFVGWPEAEVRRVLERLVERGDVAVQDDVYTLTVLGRSEAARRFADDFAEMMKHGHGECDDPDCDCHDNPESCVSRSVAGDHLPKDP